MNYIFFLFLVFLNYVIFNLLGLNHILMPSLLIAGNEIIIVFLISIIIKHVDFKKKYVKINYDNIDTFIYYRELIKNYSISELGLIYNNRMDVYTLVSLELVSLIKKGNIHIEDNNIIIDNNKNLNYIENYLLNFFDFINLSDFKNNLINKMLNEKFFEKYRVNFNFFSVFIFAIIYLFSWYMTLQIETTFYRILAFISFLVMCIELLIIMFVEYNGIYVRTKKGHDIFLKLVGLKNYLSDFSNFNEKQLKEIYLWDDYILYSVILGQSTKIETEVLNLYWNIFKIVRMGNIKIKDINKIKNN